MSNIVRAIESSRNLLTRTGWHFFLVIFFIFNISDEGHLNSDQQMEGNLAQRVSPYIWGFPKEPALPLLRF
jgi:hypothetical protein